MRSLFTTAAILAAQTVLADDDIAWTSIGKFDLKNAAFGFVQNYGDGSGDFLLNSSFSATPWGSGDVYITEGITEAVKANDASTLKPTKLDTMSFEWPNEVKIVPKEVFGGRAIVVPDGFLVPGHANGGIYVLDMDETELTKVNNTVKLTEKKKGFFYHMGEWIDMNGDGRLDFLTARSDAKEGDGELVWLEHPEGGLDAAPWTEHIVTKGPDVGITVTTYPEYPNEVVVYAAEFFNHDVSLYRVSTVDGTLVDSRQIEGDAIDQAYMVTIVDLDNDGKLRLLINNHETKSSMSGIWTYDIPSDIMTGEFTKNTIATGFDPVFNLFVPGMCPGFPYAVWPNGTGNGGHAHIFVAGDGDYKAHDLYPTDSLTYTDEVITDAKGTVGSLDFSDLDGDGWMEMWMPNYDKSYVEVFKFHAAPAKAFLQ